MSSIERGVSTRAWLLKTLKAYVNKMAPKKYHDALTPDFEMGAKRRM